MPVRSKRGRKAKDFKCGWDGTTINGLYRKPDTDVWRVRATGQEYTCHDEREAVRRFHELRAAKSAKLDLVVASGQARTKEQVAAIVEQWQRSGGTLRSAPDGNVEIVAPVEELAFWRRVREELELRPKYAAQMTGVEELAYLPKLKKPTAAPRLDDLIEQYVREVKHGKLSHHEKVRSRTLGDEFVRLSGATTLAEVTHAAVSKYQQKVFAVQVHAPTRADPDATGPLSPKSVAHRFGKIKTIIAFTMDLAEDKTQFRQALDSLRMLKPPSTGSPAPRPIQSAVFWSFYRAAMEAEDATFATMLLVMLNCCMYPGEAAALKWQEIDLKRGEVVTTRPKNGVVRVAVLWPETSAALKALPQDHDEVFIGERQPYNANMVLKQWVEYRNKLKFADAKPSDIRDGAYTEACRVEKEQACRVLAGHKLPGQMDKYVQRNPGFVADACRAIANAFDVPGNVERVAAQVAQHEESSRRSAQ